MFTYTLLIFMIFETNYYFPVDYDVEGVQKRSFKFTDRDEEDLNKVSTFNVNYVWHVTEGRTSFVKVYFVKQTGSTPVLATSKDRDNCQGWLLLLDSEQKELSEALLETIFEDCASPFTSITFVNGDEDLTPIGDFKYPCKVLKTKEELDNLVSLSIIEYFKDFNRQPML